MADVQVEHGYTRIAHELLEALARAPLPGARHFQVMLAMIRLLYGYNRSEDRIGSAQLAELTGLDPSNVRAVLRELVDAQMLEHSGGATSKRTWRIQKDHDRWAHPGRRQPGSYTTPVVHDSSRPRPDPRVVHDPRTRVVHDPHQRKERQFSKDTTGGAVGPTKQDALKQARPKPAGQEAVAIFCEEFKAARGVNPAVPPKDAKALHELHRQIGPERLRGAARVYMRLSDDFVRKAVYSPAVFVARITQCDEEAQTRAPPAQAGQQAEMTDEQLKEHFRRVRERELARMENRR